MRRRGRGRWRAHRPRRTARGAAGRPDRRRRPGRRLAGGDDRHGDGRRAVPPGRRRWRSEGDLRYRGARGVVGRRREHDARAVFGDRRPPPLVGAPTVVTRTVSPSGSESLVETSNTSGALPATAWYASSNASGARFSAGSGMHADEHLADRELAAGVDERVRQAVGAGERGVGCVDDLAVLDRGDAAGGLGAMLSTAMMSPSGSESLATAAIGWPTPLRVRAMSVRAIGGRLTSSAGTMPDLDERAGPVAGDVGDGVAEREAGHRRRCRRGRRRSGR